METSSEKMDEKMDKKKKANGNERAIRAALQGVVSELGGVFVGRSEVARGIVVAMLAREHTFLLGPPGTAKSAMVRTLCDSIGARYWEYMLTRFTDPNEIFGPIDLQTWSTSGEYVRRTDGTMLSAEIAFADEIFKANSSILNSLLAVLNERTFHEGGRLMRVPLRSCVAASNELPEGGTAGELAALFDRFLLRFEVDKVRDRDGFCRVVNGPAISSIVAKVSLEDLDRACDFAAQVPVPDSVAASMHSIDETLYRECGIDISLRRWKGLKKILKASAWLAGDSVVDELHFDVLVHGLWDEPNQRAKVQKVVSKTASPLLAEALSAHDAIMEAHDGLPTSGSAKDAGGVTVNQEMQTAAKQIAAISARATGPTKDRIEVLCSNVLAAQKKLAHRLGVELGIYADDQAESTVEL